jgi:hypothetical protein
MHGKTGTTFDLADDVYIAANADIAAHLADIDAYAEDITDIVVQKGYVVTAELAQVLYEVVMNYHSRGELPVIRYDLHN